MSSKTPQRYTHPEFENLSIQDLLRYANEFDLDSFLIAMRSEFSFFSDIMRRMNKRIDFDIPTIGVGIKNDNLYLYYNPLFLGAFAAIKEQRQKIYGIMMHEIYHVCLGHLSSSRKLEPHSVWNIATDLYINSVIPENMMPECGFKPGRKLKWTPSLDSKTEALNQKLSALIESMPPKLASEQYFKMLMQDEEIKNHISSSEMSFDSHEKWGDNSEEGTDSNSEYIKAKIQAMVREAIEESRKGGRWGNVPAEIRKDIETFAFGKIDWKTVLRNFVGMTMRSDREASIHRVNKKYPGIYSGVKTIYQPRIAVYIDQSGSVSDEELSLMFTELDKLSKLTSFHIFHFDSHVDEESEMVWKKGSKIPAKRTRIGGTSFEACHEHYLKEKRFDGMIIMTDGGSGKPSSARYRRAYVVVPNRKLEFDKDARDILIQMD